MPGRISDRWRELSEMSAVELLAAGDERLVSCVLERYWNDGSPSGFGPEMAGASYAPSGPVATFDLEMERVDRDRVTFVGEPSEWHRVGKPASGSCLIPVHPGWDASSAQRERGPTAIPLASARTVAVIRDGEVADTTVKLHLPSLIGRFSRDLSAFKVLASLERSRRMRAALAGLEALRVQPELGGCLVEADASGRGFGFIVRRAWSAHAGASLSVPFFSLWASPRVGEVSVLNALSDSLAMEPADLVFDLANRLVRAYAFLSLDYGLMPELNAQNLVLSVDVEKRMMCIEIRDMQDVFVDLAQAPFQSDETLIDYKVLVADSDDLYRRRSFSFDFKLGTYVLDPLIWRTGLRTSASRKVAKSAAEAGRAAFSRHESYFGRQQGWYSYPPTASVSRAGYVFNKSPATYR